MNSYLVTKLPTIYADMNVFRYVAYGDISITDPDRFIWVYSHVHLDEINRNGNTDALEGMKALRAVEISDVLNENFQSVGNETLTKYIDPHVRYEQHLETISGYENINDHMVEHLIRSFGADNFAELSKTPDQMREEIDRITSIIDGERRESIIERAAAVSEEMKDVIETHLKERRPIDKTRNEFGITSEDRKMLKVHILPLMKFGKLFHLLFLIFPKTNFLVLNLPQELKAYKPLILPKRVSKLFDYFRMKSLNLIKTGVYQIK